MGATESKERIQSTPPLRNHSRLGATCTENLSGNEEFLARNKEYINRVRVTGLGAHDARGKVESRVKLDYGELSALYFV